MTTTVKLNSKTILDTLTSMNACEQEKKSIRAKLARLPANHRNAAYLWHRLSYAQLNWIANMLHLSHYVRAAEIAAAEVLTADKKWTCARERLQTLWSSQTPYIRIYNADSYWMNPQNSRYEYKQSMEVTMPVFMKELRKHLDYSKFAKVFADRASRR
jgi:hypothetical protein